MPSKRVFIDSVTLRNTYRVYKSGNNYVVRQTTEKHKIQTFEYLVRAENVRRVGRLFEGTELTIRELANYLEAHSGEFTLDYTYGYKLYYVAEHILLVLCALGRAEVEREGRGFIFRLA